MTTIQSPEAISDNLYITPPELARLARVAEGTLSNWRLRNAGPPYLRVEGAIRYRRSDVAEWLDHRRVLTR